MEPKVLEPEQIVAMAVEASKMKGDDFCFKLQRKQTLSALPNMIATLEGGRIEHFAHPERWVDRLAGAGPYYWLTAFHATDPHTPIGGPILLTMLDGEPHRVNPLIVREPDWTGPSIITYPAVPKNIETPEQQRAFVSVPPGGLPPRDATTPSGNGTAGGPPATATGLTPEQRIAQQYEELARRQQGFLEERHKLEVEAVKRDEAAKAKAAEDRAARLERQLEDARRAVVVPPPPAGGGWVEKLLPLGLEFLKSDRELKVQIAQMQMTAQAEAARQQAAAAAATAESNRQMFAALQANNGKSDGTEKILAGMSAVMNTSVSQSMNMLNTMVELGFAGREPSPEPEPGWAKAIERAIKGLGALSMAQRAQQQQQPQQQQVQPQQQPRVIQGQVARPAPHQVQQQQQVQQQPAPEAPEALQQSAPQPGPTTPGGVLDMIAGDIRARQKAPAEIAASILDNFELLLQSPAIVRAGGDFRVLFEDMMGLPWLADPSNRAYAKSVIADFIEQGIRRDLFDAGLREKIEELTSGLGEPNGPDEE